MPLQNIQFALIRPVLPPGHQTGFDGILENIEPFLMIAFACAKLPVEKIFLPDWLFFRAWPASGHISPPKFHPTFERRDRNFNGSTEKVQVIWHDNIAANQPMISLSSGFNQQFMNPGVCQPWTATSYVATDKLNYRLVWKFQR